jgi:hypothetical protein
VRYSSALSARSRCRDCGRARLGAASEELRDVLVSDENAQHAGEVARGGDRRRSIDPSRFCWSSEAEQLRKENPTLEVVLLNAADEADLRRTHSRYFESIDELLEPAWR